MRALGIAKWDEFKMGILREIAKRVLIGVLINGVWWFIKFIAHIFGFSSDNRHSNNDILYRSKYTSSYKVSVGHMRPSIYDFTIKYSHFGV